MDIDSKTGKKKATQFIPYKKENGEIFVFLQKRAKDANRLPDFFGYFGGHVEVGETFEQALLREVKEELNYDLTQYTFLGEYEFERSIKQVFYMLAPANFEQEITVLEGEYGKYFSIADALAEPKFIDEDKTVLRELLKILDQ